MIFMTCDYSERLAVDNKRFRDLEIHKKGQETQISNLRKKVEVLTRERDEALREVEALRELLQRERRVRYEWEKAK